MNCKQGDLAIIVKSNCGNEGKIVRVLELYVPLFVDSSIAHHTFWKIDRKIQATNMLDEIIQIDFCTDAQLRPISDQEGEDEMIRIAGKPVIQELPQTVAISNK
jgi:hypothetical protein